MSDLSINVGLAGEYRIVVNEGTPEERDYGWFPNVITDIGLERIGAGATDNSNDCLFYARIGTGTTTPQTTDVALDTQVAASGTRGGSSGAGEGSPNYSYLQTCYYTFAQGAVVGNMAEIGVGWATTGATLFSRARIVDGSGNPTTITLLSIDQLTVYYRLRWYPPLTTSTSGILTLSGVDYPYSARSAQIANFISGAGSGSGGIPSPGTTGGSMFVADTILCYSGQTLGATTGEPTGYDGAAGLSYPTGMTRAAYSAASHERTTTFTFGTGNGNVSGGIGGFVIRFVPYMQFQFVFTGSKIPKDNTKTMSLSATISWARKT